MESDKINTPEDTDEAKISSDVSSEEDLKNEELKLPGKSSELKQPNFKAKNSLWQKAKLPIIFVAGVLVVSGIVFTVYSFVKNIQKDKKSDSSAASTAATTEQTQPETSEVSILSESYTSNSLRLSFKYPSDWKVNEVDRGIRVESPNFTFTSKGQGEVNGNFRVYIKKGARSIDGKFLGDGYAVSPSSKLEYSDPANGQRDSTWLTDFGLKTTDNFAYFVVQGNYELKKGATLGPSFAKEADAYLIAGGYSKPDLTDDLDMVLLPVDGDYNQSPQYKTATSIVQSLQLR